MMSHSYFRSHAAAARTINSYLSRQRRYPLRVYLALCRGLARTLSERAPGEVELGVVYASVGDVNEHSFHECREELKHKGHELGDRFDRAATGAKSVSMEPAHQPAGDRG